MQDDPTSERYGSQGMHEVDSGPVLLIFRWNFLHIYHVLECLGNGMLIPADDNKFLWEEPGEQVKYDRDVYFEFAGLCRRSGCGKGTVSINKRLTRNSG